MLKWSIMLSSEDTPKRDGRNCKHCEDPPIEGKPPTIQSWLKLSLRILKWKDSMHTAQNEDTHHLGQYGSRPGRDSTTLVTLLEEVKLYYFMSTLKPHFRTSPTKALVPSWYDDIILKQIASSVSKGFGIYSDVVFVHEKILKDATFKLNLRSKILKESIAVVGIWSHCCGRIISRKMEKQRKGL